ncbi:MAG: hypothetical protein VB877_15665 [Pirellulaceae bacterium]
MFELNFLVGADLDIALAGVADGNTVKYVSQGYFGEYLVADEILAVFGDVDNDFFGTDCHGFGFENLSQVDGDKAFLLIELGRDQEKDQQEENDVDDWREIRSVAIRVRWW